jgi:two-component system LytT family response regulator
MNLRVLIVDDEALSRDRIRRFLKAEAGAEVIGECASGKEAVSAIREHAPDVVLLDVTMPEMDGFDVLEELEGGVVPAVIFVTAHDQFAIQAFEIHAVDYLLKPFGRVRLHTALCRARERVQLVNHQPFRPPQQPNGPSARRLECIPVRSSGRIRILKPVEIDWIGSADNYAELHVGSHTHLLRVTLTTLAGQLFANQFARISRSALVNLDRVQEMRPRSHGDYVVVLRDGTCLQGSRKYRDTIARLLGRGR